MSDGLHDEQLDKLVGEWRIVREFKSRKAENRARAEWVLNHQFVRLHMRDVNEPPGYEATVFIGFDSTQQQYVAHWIDTFGAQFSAMASGKREGNSIALTFNYPDGLVTNTFAFDERTNSWTSKIDQQNEAGVFVPFCFDTYKGR